MKNTYKQLLLLALLTHSSTLLSATFINLDFETPATGNPLESNKGYPVWTLTPILKNLYGQGNQYIVTDTAAHSGTYSLKYSYDGRNGFCNNCGTYGVKHKEGIDGVDYFIADNDQDLTLQENLTTTKKNDGPAAQSGRKLFNKSNGFSIWAITSVDSAAGAKNNKLSVKLLRSGIDDKKPEFNSGDNIAIARQCGVDGHIGGQKDRRNDCDAAIVWFGNIINSQPFGTSIFRRMYLKAELTDPIVHQKLHYFLAGNKADGNKGSILLVADGTSPPHTLLPQVVGLGAPNNDLSPKRNYGAQNIYKPGNGISEGIQFKRGVWYYIEVQYKAQSTLDSADGEYRLWFNEAGNEDANSGKPIIELTGLTLPPMQTIDAGPKISFWGNTQHLRHLHGNWYIDDVVIGTERIGAKIGDGKNTFPPNSPDTNN